uniref:Uncharacterized protein n=1 Tax=Ciona savignyi TaxID=51511 RepID=H2ZJZ1_CIOSA
MERTMNGGNSVLFLTSTLSTTNCSTTRNISSTIDQFSTDNATTLEVEEILTELDLKTSVTQAVSENDTTNVIDFIATISTLAGMGQIMVTPNIYEKVVSIADHVTAKVQDATYSTQASSLLYSLEQIGFEVDVTQSSFDFLTPNIAAQ